MTNSQRKKLTFYFYFYFYFLFNFLDGILLFGIVVFYAFQGLVVFVFTFLLYSFWVPQIIHNVKNDCRKPLNMTYVVVSSASRLFLPLCTTLFSRPPREKLASTAPFVLS